MMRTVVCGTNFGQVYLEAFRSCEIPFELAGIVAQGSERSRACARHYGVPLYTSAEELPAGIDAACVVVRGGLLGGHGTELARSLLARGVHVLQEHPLHHDELAGCLREARRNGVVYHLNSFYVELAPVRRFVAAARELFRRQPPVYVDAACGFQVAYALLDILGTALGKVRPWRFAEAGPRSDPDLPFRSLDGVLGGVPLSLRIQNQLDPTDPDRNAHLLHRVTLGTEGGNITLVTTHGPIVWSARPQIPSRAGDPAQPFATDDRPSAIVLGPGEAPSHRVIFGSVWPEGVARALRALHQAITEGADPLARGQYHLALCQLWQDIASRLGPPDLVRCEPPRPLEAADLSAMAAAGTVA